MNHQERDYLDAITAERDEARRLYDAALRDHVTLIHQCEAAEAEVARLAGQIERQDDEFGAVIESERSALAEVARLREALTEAKAQIGHGAFCNCVVCSPLIAALAAPTKEDTETVDWELDRRDVQRSLRQAPTLRETT